MASVVALAPWCPSACPWPDFVGRRGAGEPLYSLLEHQARPHGRDKWLSPSSLA